MRTPLGWLQLRHDRGRFLVALAGIAFADLLMFMQLGFQAALYDSNTRLDRSFKADVVLISPRALNLQNLSTFPRRRLLQALDVPGVVDAQGPYIRTVTWRNPQTLRSATVQVLGFDPDADVLRLPEVMAQADRLKIPDTVLFDRGARGQYQEAIARIERGERVTSEIDRRTITVEGLFRLGASFGADATLMTSDQTFLRIFPQVSAGSVSVGLLTLAPGQATAPVVEALRRHLPNDVRVLSDADFIQFEENYWRMASPVGFILGLGTAMAFVVGVVIVYQVLSTDVNAHLQEYATFKAMGFRNRYLLLVVMEQALILAAFGFIPGALMLLWLYAVAAKATSLPIAMTLGRVTTVFVLTLLMCLASGAIATRRLQAADPAELF
ncbi:MAG: ABC transporter permease DevC [Synechococcus sp.]